MFTTLAVGARILDHVSPGKLSALRIRVWDLISALNDRYILSSFKQNMPFYISRYFTSQPLTPFLLAITNSELRLCDVIQSSAYGQSFDIAIKTFFTDQKDTDDVVACFLDTFTLSPTISRNSSLFKPITELTLGLFQVQPTIILKIYSMLAVFQHVQAIETNERSGETFWTISCLDEAGGNQQRILFTELLPCA